MEARVAARVPHNMSVDSDTLRKGAARRSWKSCHRAAPCRNVPVTFTLGRGKPHFLAPLPGAEMTLAAVASLKVSRRVGGSACWHGQASSSKVVGLMPLNAVANAPANARSNSRLSVWCRRFTSLVEPHSRSPRPLGRLEQPLCVRGAVPQASAVVAPTEDGWVS